MLRGEGEYTYELVDEWAKLPQGWTFSDVCGIAVDSQDRVYVLNRSQHPIIVFDQDGDFLSTWGNENTFKRAHGCCITPDSCIYCTDDGYHTVRKFTLDGKLLLTLGSKDKPSDSGFVHIQGFTMSSCYHTIKRGAPPFNRPTGVAVSSSGEIYVADGYGNARVHKFSSEGELLLSWGEPGTDRGQFRLPHSVHLDKRQRVWVADRENSRIQIFSEEGEPLAVWTDVGRPTDIFIDQADNVYISELNERVSIFNTDGRLLARWGSEGPYEDRPPIFIAPHAIAVDSQGDIYVGEVTMSFTGIDRGARTIQKFARKIKR